MIISDRVNPQGQQTKSYILVHACLREEFEELELSQGAKAKEGVLERKDFFNGHFPSRRLVDCCSDSTVGALSETMEDAVIFA